MKDAKAIAERLDRLIQKDKLDSFADEMACNIRDWIDYYLDEWETKAEIDNSKWKLVSEISESLTRYSRRVRPSP